jgi:hypothetical protein
MEISNTFPNCISGFDFAGDWRLTTKDYFAANSAVADPYLHSGGISRAIRCIHVISVA